MHSNAVQLREYYIYNTNLSPTFLLLRYLYMLSLISSLLRMYFSVRLYLTQILFYLCWKILSARCLQITRTALPLAFHFSALEFRQEHSSVPEQIYANWEHITWFPNSITFLSFHLLPFLRLNRCQSLEQSLAYVEPVGCYSSTHWCIIHVMFQVSSTKWSTVRQQELGVLPALDAFISTSSFFPIHLWSRSSAK
jgi:hypothetical protein